MPETKQAAAREAFRDILDGREDDGTLTRLLLVFEATSAYGEKIPHEMTMVMEKYLHALDCRMAQFTENAEDMDIIHIEQFTKALQEQLPAIAKAISPEIIAEEIGSMRVSIDRLERSSRRQRNLRLTVVAICMMLSGMACAGGVIAWFKNDYDTGQRALGQFTILHNYGLTLRLNNGDNQSLRVHINGNQPFEAVTALINNSKQKIGVEFTVPVP